MAVQDGYGKSSGSESLVFAYDLKDAINSYRGEPTINLATDNPTRDGWPGSSTLIDSTTKTFDFVTSSVEWGGNAAWSTFYYNVSEYTGQYVTISAMVESFDETNGLFSFMWIGQTIDEQTYLGYSPEQDRNQKNTKTRERISWSGVIGNGGKVGILIWMNNGSGGSSGSVKVRFSNIQVERKSHPTSFINGTRSNTQGLLDLTGNNSIDLSNVSFDSNAKMVFDGTNDYIGFGDVSGNIGGKSQATMELILKINALKSNDLQEVFGFRNNSNFDFYMIILPSENSGLTEFRVRNSSGTYYDLNPNINSYIGNYVHIIFSVGPGGRNVYFNGSLVSSSPTWTGSFGATSPFSIGNYLVGMVWSVLGEIPVAKLYDRELSTTEITNNYLKYKRQYGLT